MQDSYAIQLIQALQQIAIELRKIQEELHSLKIRVGQLKQS